MSRKKYKHLTQVQTDRLHEYYARGLKPREIAELLGVSARTVRRYIYGKYKNSRLARQKHKAALAEACNVPSLRDNGCYYTSPRTGQQVPLPDFGGDPLDILIALEELEESGEID